MRSEPVVTVNGLAKKFGATKALQDVSFTLQPGEVVGLVGANGAGKTTLLETILGAQRPSAGECITLSAPVSEIGSEELQLIGFVGQEDPLIPWMRAGQLLKFLSTHYPTWDRQLEHQLINLLNVPLGSRIGDLSPGERQRLALAASFSYRPKLLLLDEPGSSLDPEARRELLQLLIDFMQSGEQTIVISSHILADLEKISDRLLVLQGGKLVFDGRLDELKEQFRRFRVSSLTESLPPLEKSAHVLSVEQHERQAVLIARGAGIPSMRELAASRGWVIEESFLALEELYPLLLAFGGNND